MKVLLINGSLRKNGNTAAALDIVEKELAEKGVETSIFQIGAEPVRGCISCGSCIKTNRCVFADDGCNELIERISGSDGIIVGTPVYFAGPSGALCSLLDRVFYATCTYSQMFKGKAAAALATCEWVGGSAAVDRLHRYFVPCQMTIVNCSDFPVFQGSSVKDGNPRAIKLLKELAGNMAAQLR